MEENKNISNDMSNEYAEYETFFTTTKTGEEVELAIVDRFIVDGKNYVAASLIVGDEISDEGVFVYRSKKIGDELIISKIEDMKEYEKVSEAYSKM